MKKNIKYFVFLVVVLLFQIVNVKADIGPKPSIRIHLLNMKESDYLIDLLVEDLPPELLENDYCFLEQGSNSIDCRNEPIYKYNENGWSAKALRVPELLWGNVQGNTKHTHVFRYRGVPTKFKVIIQFSDKTIKVSDIIERKNMNLSFDLDVKTMKVVKTRMDLSIKNMAIILLSTIVIEVIIALLMKMHSIKKIIITNAVTNILLQLILGIFFYESSHYLIAFFVGELFVLLIEYFLYIHYKDMLSLSKKRIFAYTFIANLITTSLTFLI